MPSNFCKDTYVEYSLFLSEEKHRTKTVAGKERSPVFEYAKHHTQECVTENFLKYLKDECLVFNLFGFPDVKKEKKEIQGKASSKKKLET